MKTKVADFIELSDNELQNINGGERGSFLYDIAYGISYAYHSTINAICGAAQAVENAFTYGMEAQVGRIYPVI